jgi:hypothetical protein
MSKMPAATSTADATSVEVRSATAGMLVRQSRQQHVPEPRIGTAEVIDQRPEHHGWRELEHHPDRDARQHQQVTALVRRELGERPPQQRARHLDPPVLARVDGHTRAYAVVRHADSVSASGRAVRCR